MSIWTDSKGRRHVGVMVDGKRVHRICPPGTTASGARRIEAEVRTAIGKRDVIIPGDPAMTAVMALYVEHAKSLRSPETATQHAKRTLSWLEGRKASDARHVAAEMIRDMQAHYAAATINRSIGALSKALRLAWDRGLTATDYSAHVKRIAENNRRDVVLTLEQVRAIADHASESVAAAIWIALYTGCRRGELCAIAATDIGPDAITIRAGNTKTLRTRKIPIIAPLRPWLRHLPLSINFEGLKSGFRRAREAAGMPDVTFHDLRRSCATMMIEAGVDLYVVSKLLGHSSVAVTQQRYAYLQTQRIAEGLEKTFG